MGLTNSQINLIKAVAENDIRTAKNVLYYVWMKTRHRKISILPNAIGLFWYLKVQIYLSFQLT